MKPLELSLVFVDSLIRSGLFEGAAGGGDEAGHSPARDVDSNDVLYLAVLGERLLMEEF